MPNNDPPTPEEMALQARAAADVFNVITNALTQLQTGQTRIEASMARQSERMDILVNTTNHRLDDFHEEIDRHRTDSAAAVIVYQKTVADALALKANRGDLITDVLRTNRAIQAGIAALVIAIAPVIIDHWHLLYERASSLF